MVSSQMKFTSIIFLACSLFLRGTLAELICEALPEYVCTFGISSSGKRCVLENYHNDANGDLDYTCNTSEVVVEGILPGYLETDNCVTACGVDRKAVGISSDAFLSPEFTSSLCSPACYQNCPNIIDLYFNLAAGEGVFLPNLCMKQRTSPKSVLFELLSSNGDADPETTMDDGGVAPSPAPSTF